MTIVPFSAGIEIQKSNERQLNKTAHNSYDVLIHNYRKIRKYCESYNKDWVTLIVGEEGSGKSNMGY